ncbi:GNAT family N-acetyltransferase [Devosia rhizoryzae]|uniref:GNAT family N-acetyltransferase n=1 Tax=Devosia rhizoryzae TaxID=2774137 RepID=A0ABX7CCX1_9HYPH|nr:GNAT family N-acetyltransferase [Devosia rhizoryzae]QQR40617.1 GNAT family N-acetyltransferase [Devosia rhizoryzae]
MSLTLRPAQKADAAEIALLVNIAVHGNMARGWAQDDEAEGTYEPLEVGRLEMLKDDVFSWRSATMAEADGEIAGMLLGYRKPDTRQKVPADIWAPLRPIQELEEEANGRWFISMLGVHKSWRSKGVGSLLLDEADRLTGSTKANGQALIVEDANDGARKLYERRGFSVMASRPMVPFPGVLQHGSDWLLMVKE